ncbi:polymorphic toxin type 23 domain-containing protein [Saprospira grandis]|uniref:Bacterial toxin 23 domain-containing protein n=1 Tax=Saprospira grandis (strain Lewin) TaxID=984262 RepID=H6L1Z5_SAPGL|nr:polymorphic toxin type 23 domain-containing protein [Saprospira grandis]AFC23532.1 hypothetical protein SGRA_0794 [Saprospira grandis str. Lewin]
MKRPLFFLFFLLSSSFLSAQSLSPHFGGQLGISFSLGTHLRRMGLMGHLYYAGDFYQLNLQWHQHYNWSARGTDQRAWESQIKLGAQGSWGPKYQQVEQIHPFLTAAGQQTARPYALGYAYIFYLDQWKTSQRSGIFSAQIKDFRFFFENDFLAFQSLDRYRTGAMGLHYRYKDWQFGFSNITYTGDAYSPYSPWISNPNFPSASGYIDMASAPYGDKSLGVLALKIDWRPHFEALSHDFLVHLQPQLSLRLGVDAEQIRNLVQNKWIHDSKLLPLNWNEEKNPHIPMVDSEGCSYLYLPGQKIRRPRFFGELQLNEVEFY